MCDGSIVPYLLANTSWSERIHHVTNCNYHNCPLKTKFTILFYWHSLNSMSFSKYYLRFGYYDKHNNSNNNNNIRLAKRTFEYARSLIHTYIWNFRRANREAERERCVLSVCVCVWDTYFIWFDAVDNFPKSISLPNCNCYIFYPFYALVERTREECS